MRGLAIFSLVLLMSMFTIGCENTQAEKYPHGRAFNFETEDINGNKVRLSDYSGKIIILNFFATWCPPCRAEMPAFNEIRRKYEHVTEIIAVNVGKESLSGVQEFANINDLEFTIVMDDGRLSDLYGPISAIPVTVIIDRDFNIARRYVGMRPKEIFINDIEELL